MKKTKLYLPVLLVLLASCANEKETVTRGTPILIYPNVNTRATDTGFESGDPIGVSISLDAKHDYKENVRLVHNGTHFTSEDVQWYESNREGTFEAYYPFREVMPNDFSVSLDQSGEGYTQSDLMLSRVENVKPNPSGVSMNFNHLLSQLVVRIISDAPLDIASVTVGGTQPDGTVKFDEMSVTAKYSSEVKDILAQKIQDQTYRVVLIPQTADVVVKIELEGGRKLERQFASHIFSVGSSYIARITVDDFDITDIEIISNGDINQWENGNDLAPAN